MAYLALVLVALLVLAISRLWNYVVVRLIWKPHAMAKKFREQGIHGPPYRFLKGCNQEISRLKKEADGLVLDVHNHNYLPRIMPHFLKWKEQYGEKFIYWFEQSPRICIFEYELARQILISKSGHFLKIDAHPAVLAILGKGLVMVEGADWVRHRRVINPAFAIDKLKMMTKTMAACAQGMIKEWEEEASRNRSGEKEIEISKQFQELTANVISHTAFGSSFREGKEAFNSQKELLAMAMATLFNVQIPGFNYLPTRRNCRKWMLEKKLRSILMKIIQSRLASEGSEYGNDLLGLMLKGCISTEQGGKREKLRLSVDEIMHECKTFFFAGYETTSVLLTWTVFLLCVHPEWQDRLREEVLRECGNETPNADDLGKLKEMTMVLLESLRLYCPPLYILRKAETDMTLGGIKLPKGVGIVIPIPSMHRDKEVWGEDAEEFNPSRFQNGITRAAKVPYALLAFSAGPRSCIGQNFAILEAKSIMVKILQKFSFTLSPKYVHAPTDVLTLHPKFGLRVVLRSLDV